MSHAAFAGAIFGTLVGVDPTLAAFAFSFLSALLIGPVADRGELNPDTAIGIIFSIMLGLAFLFMGLIPGPKTQALGLIWGNILTVTRCHLRLMFAICALVVSIIVLLFKEIQAVIFHREIAASVGIPERAIFYSVLFLTGAVITTSFKAIGGLLIFSLVTNPAAAAYQLTYSLKKMFLLSASFGVASCLAGLFFSYVFNVPSGAVIIITSSLLFALAMAFSPKRRVKPFRSRAAALKKSRAHS
ncbi:MAG: metal ABC transporter permease [bacterium]